MSKEADNQDYFLVARREDSETGTLHEIWSKRAMTDTQVEEMFSHSKNATKVKFPDHRNDAIKVWVDDAFFDPPAKEPI